MFYFFLSREEKAQLFTSTIATKHFEAPLSGGKAQRHRVTLAFIEVVNEALSSTCRKSLHNQIHFHHGMRL